MTKYYCQDDQAPLVNAPPEQALNPLLRRADWRFILPDPQPHMSICYTRGFLAQAVRAISDRQVDPQDASRGTCDLAAAVDPDRKTLEAAWTALRAGGMCYTEWYSPSSANYQGVRRRLSAAGFEQVSCYWAWPLPTRAPAIFWIPLQAPGAQGYFMSHRPPDASKLRNSLRALVRFLWRVAHDVGLTFPVLAVARKPVDANTAATRNELNPALLDSICAHWEEWGLGPAPDRLSWLLLTGGENSNNKAVGLVFGEPDARARIAVKMPRVPGSVPGLLREKTTLEQVYADRKDLVGIPQILFCQQRGAFVALGETALEGVPLYTRLERSNYRQLALAASNWQIQLAGQGPPVPSEAWWGQLVEPLLEEFNRSFGSVVEPDRCARAREVLGTLGALPLVCEQRDFSPWNVMVTANDQLAVLDWESSETRGLPAADLIYFLAHAGFFLDGAWRTGRFRESYQTALDVSTLTGSVQSETLSHYAGQVCIPSYALGPLRLYTWMVHACSQYRRALGSGIQPSTEWLRLSSFLNLWEEEMRRYDR
ncbi:MAG: phosphotransferase family protein [Acidobacteriota bacterium]